MRLPFDDENVVLQIHGAPVLIDNSMIETVDEAPDSVNYMQQSMKHGDNDEDVAD